MIGVSACMAAFAVVIAMAGLSTSSVLPPVDGVGDAIGQMRALATTSTSSTSCVSELTACRDDESCSACLDAEAEDGCELPSVCSDVNEYVCCVLPEDCYDETLLYEYTECLFEYICTASDLSCTSSSGAAGVMAEAGSTLGYAVGAALGATALGAADYLL